MKSVTLVALLFFKPLLGFCQFNKEIIIESIKRDITYRYVSEEIGAKMCDSITKFLQAGKYDSLNKIDDFTFELTKDLRRVSRDNHIQIVASPIQRTTKPTKLRRFKRGKFDQTKIINRYLQLLNKPHKDNYEYGEVKILSGNIGYLEIISFNSKPIEKHDKSKQIDLEEVMKFLKNTKAIIIDLRRNSGGDVNQAIMFCSYFSDSINAYYFTHQSNYRYDSVNILKRDSIIQRLHTRPDISNTYSKGKKIYVLVGEYTFSAAELVTYGIKKLNSNAVILGSKTSGAGNTHSGYTDSYRYSATIPSGKIYDEHNNNFNLEGIGVFPDIKIDSDSALEIACKLLNPDISGFASTDKYLIKRTYSLTSYFINHVEEYVGNYKKAKIIFQDNKLYMIYDLNKILLEQIDNNLFVSNGFKAIYFFRDFRRAIKIKLVHENGLIESYDIEN